MMTPSLQRHVESVLGARIDYTTTASGGFSPAARERIVLMDGRRAFVKAGTDADTKSWLRDEWRVYGGLSAPFVPEVLHWSSPEAVLILEDLGDCERAPPWTARAVAAVLKTLAEVSAADCPPDVPALDTSHFRGWQESLSGLDRIAALGVATPKWVHAHGPILAKAEASAVLSGDSLLHLDVRGDNLFLRSDRAVLVDWNWAQRGNAAVDRAFWAPSLQLDGGPPPERVVGHAPELAATVAGFFAFQAAQPVEQATPAIRAFQRAQLRCALPWAARALDLPLEGLVEAD
jgi:hypothetical protein